MLSQEQTTKLAQQLDLKCDNCPNNKQAQEPYIKLKEIRGIKTQEKDNCRVCLTIQAFTKLPKEKQLEILSKH